ncbi:MAG: amidohydrolase family protein [Firmicutes bacterium]|jgi:N-acyl-D-amino-acid deacylase|nr:amidohydrolase family protein [Bacillota bacterium]
MKMDLVIANGKVVDFNKSELVEKNIGIKNGKIHSLTSADISGQTVLDAAGSVVSPGFIDIHNHSDYNFNVGAKDPFETAKHLLLMGVTTSIGGNCGSGRTDIETYFDYIEKNGAPNNYLGFVGHRKLREEVGITDVYRAAKNTEIKKMQELAKKAVENGAVGISFGLEYSPGASFEELVEVGRVLREYPNTLLSAHYRYDADRSLEALEELIELSKETGVPMQVSHLNSGICFGYAREGLEMLETAYRQGLDIMADAYPYSAFSTSAGSAVFDDGCLERWGVGYDSIMVAGGEHAGKRCDKQLFEHIRKTTPDIPFIAFVMKEEEVDRVIAHPLVMVGSDGNINDGHGHPRASGTFPRVLHRYAAGKGVETLLLFLEKMTKLPAQRLGIKTKGDLFEGADADIVIFNKDNTKDNATFESPIERPSGIDYVLVGGKIAVDKGIIKKTDSGKVIKLK